MSKSPDAFRTISEVADWLGVQAHVLRFWESRFSQVKPVKRAGGRRYYRPNDMRLLGGIKKLLHEDGITIKGVQRILREQGVAHVTALSPSLDREAEEHPQNEDSVVPFIAKPETPPASQPQDLQIDLDLSPEPVDKAIGNLPIAASETNAKTPSGAEICPAPPFAGVASKAWQATDFDDEMLRRIAPIARDLRAWLSRVENQSVG